MTKDGSETFVSMAQAAEELGLTRQAMYKYLLAGTIKASKIGKTYIVPMAQIQKLRKERIAQLRKQLANLESQEGRN